MKMFTTIQDSATILNFFIDHYYKAGYNQFIIGVFTGKNSLGIKKVQSQLSESFKSLCTLEEYSNGNSGRRPSTDTDWMQSARERLCRDAEWHGITDLDEFHNYGKPIKKLIQELDKNKETCLKGVLRDRLAQDGSLPTLNYKKSLEDQFPLKLALTHSLLGGDERKICLIKGHKQVNPGHHKMLDGSSCKAKIAVDHYKWHYETLERIENRLKDYLENHVHQSIESFRLLQHLKNNDGKIRIKDFKNYK
jgi:hypothetical protein